MNELQIIWNLEEMKLNKYIKETLQKYARYKKELSAPQLQNTDQSTTVLGEVATAVKQMSQNMAYR